MGDSPRQHKSSVNMTKVRITEYLDVDLSTEMWCCNRCGKELGPASENYKKGCKVFARDPRTIHLPIVEEEKYNFAPDPDWCSYVEFYCPGCGTMIELEVLPPGHPITDDITLDLNKLRTKHAGE